MGQSTRRRGLRLVLGYTLALSVVAGGIQLGRVWTRAKPEPLPLGTVERTDLELSVVVGGEIEGDKSTLVQCELESIPGPGGGLGSSGLTILELIPDGTRVKQGDVLCRFDSSHYEELVRLQQIELQRAISEERQAALEGEAAEAALRAYRDGEALRIAKELESKVALAKADLQRAEDRLEWARKMMRIGYVSSDEFAMYRSTVLRLKLDQEQYETLLRGHRDYTVPKSVRELEVAVENARARLEFGTEQREAEEARLEKLQGLVEKCVVKAPHDGMVIHANIFYQRRWDASETFLRVGATVFQGQPLFILPDLVHPVVKLVLHESIASRIKAGMPARIRIPALPDRELTGRVQWINPVPTEQWRAFQEFQGFDAKVAIDDPPDRLLPSLTAEVKIITGTRDGALVVPSWAVAVEEGEPFCYVAGPSGIERRPVTLAPASRDRVEIVTGLEAGEQVVLDPSRFRPLPDGQIDPFPRAAPPPEATAGHTHPAPVSSRNRPT
jgi:HlyD family secretion protein